MEMWSFGKRTARQREIRRSISERNVNLFRRLTDEVGILGPLLSLVTAAVVAIILVAGGERMDLRVGQLTTRAIPARVDLEIEDRQKTLELRLRARDASPNFYRLDVALLDDLKARLANVVTLARSFAERPDDLRDEARKTKVLLSEAAAEEIARLAQADAGEAYGAALELTLARIRETPLVEPEGPIGRPTTASVAMLSAGPGAEPRATLRSTLILTTDGDAIAAAVDSACTAFSETLRPSMRASIIAMLQGETDGRIRPLYSYDAAGTNAAAAKAESLAPTQYLAYRGGDVLAPAGVLTADALQLLRAEHAAFQASGGYSRSRAIGRATLALIVVFGVAAYMSSYHGATFTNFSRRIASTVTLVLVFSAARITYLNTDLPPSVAVGFQSFAAALLGIVYAHNAVFAVCGGLGLLLTLSCQQGVGFFLMLLVASATFVFGLKEVRQRGKIVLVGLLAAIFTLGPCLAVGLIDGQRFSFVLTQAIWGAGSVLLAALIIEGILPGIERLFRLSTGMTLLEWCDVSRPLMRRLAVEAPGTYNHSLLVSTLAEAAASAIDADGLLCRAGALYHDIGKTEKPEYFAENQPTGVSRHERLSPAMSLLIIVNHVKDGIEMARQYGLPRSLLPFIAEHHGTTVVEYFYHAANKRRKSDDPEISETEYRYAGPKPQSRETAVVMMCDAVEGAVRAMAEPTPTRIESVVDEIAQKRLADGQFDECDLTFEQLAEIKKSLVMSLCSLYHGRISYPEADAEESSPGAASPKAS